MSDLTQWSESYEFRQTVGELRIEVTSGINAGPKANKLEEYASGILVWSTLPSSKKIIVGRPKCAFKHAFTYTTRTRCTANFSAWLVVTKISELLTAQ
jgi:hypothetical protein